MLRTHSILASGAAAQIVFAVACGPAEGEPEETAAVMSEALVDGARVPLRPRKVTSAGVVPVGPNGTLATARDGTDCVKLGNRTIFTFGDTLSRFTPGGEIFFVATNSMLSTTDTNFADGISTDPAQTQNFQSQGGVPIEFIPRDGNDGTPDVKIFIWPGQYFKNPLDSKTYLTHSKFVVGAAGGRMIGVGLGLAEVTSHTVASTRLVVRPNAPVHLVTGKAETRMLFTADMAGWSHMALDPEAGDVEVVKVGNDDYVYLYDAFEPENGQNVFVYVMRARLADGNADGTQDFKQFDRWQAWKGTDAQGNEQWDVVSQKQPVLTTNLADGVAKHFSVNWNAFHRAYVMTYFENGPNRPFQASHRLMMRTSPTPTGPWSAPAVVHESLEPENPYVGRTLSCLSEPTGRTEYLSYSLQGAFTGTGIKLYRLRYAGARGDLAADTRTDITILGGTGATTIPVATSNGDGSFAFLSADAPLFPELAAMTNALPVAGDFDGDGRGDLAVTGAGLQGVVLARSLGDGTFQVSSQSAGSFAGLASSSGAKIVPGDFDGNGRDDMALVGGSTNGTPWTTIPVARSNANGTLTATNTSQPVFTSQAVVAGAKPIPGDFNGDGRSDIALAGGAGWSGVVIASSTGAGTFTTATRSAPVFAAFAALNNSLPASGDFNADGVSDLALIWPPAGDAIGLALVAANGTITETQGLLRTGENLTMVDSTFNAHAAQAGARAVAGDFNGDGIGDIALVGVPASTTLPVALGTSIVEAGKIKFRVVSQAVPAAFVSAASSSAARSFGVY
jgi:hypothetical protein